MAIKVALLVVSALIAVAAAYPYESQQASTASLNCNDNAIHRTTIGQYKYELKGCTRSKTPYNSLYSYSIAKQSNYLMDTMSIIQKFHCSINGLGVYNIALL